MVRDEFLQDAPEETTRIQIMTYYYSFFCRGASRLSEFELFARVLIRDIWCLRFQFLSSTLSTPLWLQLADTGQRCRLRWRSPIPWKVPLEAQLRWTDPEKTDEQVTEVKPVCVQMVETGWNWAHFPTIHRDHWHQTSTIRLLPAWSECSEAICGSRTFLAQCPWLWAAFQACCRLTSWRNSRRQRRSSALQDGRGENLQLKKDTNPGWL